MEKKRRFTKISMVLAGLWILATLFPIAGANASEVSQKWNVQSIFPAGESLYKEFVSFTEKVKVIGFFTFRRPILASL